MVQGNTRFALDLYQQLCPIAGNLFFSPFSISSALAMTCAGAGDNTQEEMEQVLHFPADPQALHPAFAELTNRLVEIGKTGACANEDRQ